MTDKECRSQREAFEEKYSSGDAVCDAISMARREDGEYEQSLTRLCWKWFQAGAAWQQSRLLDAELGEKAFQAVINDGCGWPEHVLRRVVRVALTAAIAEIKKHLEGV